MGAGLERYQHWLVVGLAALLAAAVVFFALERRGGPAPLEINLADLTPEPGGPIEVYITGAIARPGVYEMQDGERVVDLLQKAGGFAPDADPEGANLAKRLRDEDTIVVPRLGQAAPVSNVAGVSGPVDINAAGAPELMALPGIGEAYSQRIVESRTHDGPFATTDELVGRDLVPRATYERIRDLITTGP